MTRPQTAFLVPTMLLVIACGAGEGRNTAYNSSGFDTKKDEAARADERDTARGMRASCPWPAYAAQHHVPEVASAIIDRDELDLSGRYGEPLDLVDSMMHGASRESRAFYTWVVTRTMPKTDGYYAEGLGNGARTYAESRTSEWATDLSERSCYLNKDEQAWARTIAGELLIVDENNDMGALDTCIIRLSKGCAHCPIAQQEWVRSFSTRLRMEHGRMAAATK